MSNVLPLDRVDQAAAREPPADFATEQALLGAVLLNNGAWHDAADLVAAGDFAEPAHGAIWAACGGLIGKGAVANPVTLKGLLAEALERVGGHGYLARLVSAAVSIADAADYARIVHDMALRRGLAAIGLEISSAAYRVDVDRSAAQQIEEAEAQLYRLADGGRGSHDVYAQQAITEKVITDIERRYRDPGKSERAITTGIAELDAKMLLESGDFLVLAGATSMGKSALADNIAEANEQQGVGVAIFPLEMSKEQWTLRRIVRQTGINIKRLRAGQIGQAEFDRVMDAKRALDERPCWIADSFNLTPSSLRSRVRRLKRRHGIGLVIVDYLQLMQPDTQGRQTNRTQDIGQITRSLRTIAGELGVVMIGVSQLSRGVDARDDKRPTLGDLRESGSIEQDATHVMFVYREEYYLARSKPHGRGGKPPTAQEELDHMGRVEASRGVAELIIPKQRNDEAPVTVRCAWDGMRTRFSDIDLDTPGGPAQGEML